MIKRLGLLIVLATFGLTEVFADGWSFSTSTDFAYYPKSDYVEGATHFAPLTGPYSAVEGRVTGYADYSISTPLGDHWLLKSAEVVLEGSLEVSPVSLMPGVSVKFTPLPFLIFRAGVQSGTGWNLGGLQGMASFNGADSYTDDAPFSVWLLRWFVEGTFQFDTGAVWPGDWTHFQVMYTYQLFYEHLTSHGKSDVWMWQCSGNKANGLQNYQSLVLAYAMPMVFSRAGVLCEWEGHFDASDYGTSAFGGNFEKVSISPLAQFTFGQHDSLSVLLGFSSRRSFEEPHSVSYVEPLLTYAGYEWYFNRLVLRWVHSF